MPDVREPVDLETLLATYMHNRSIIKAILDAFKESFEHFEADYHRYDSAHDQEALQRLIHSLKGSSGNLRATLVYPLSQQLEQQIQTGASELDISETLSELFAAMSELMNYIDNFSDSA